MDSDIKVIIFDLGRVLIDFDHLIAARKIARLARKTPEEIYNLFFDSSLIQSFEEGKITPRDFFTEVKKILSLTIPFEEFAPIWNKIFFVTEENKKVHRIAQQLHRRYTVALLSNVNVLHFDYIQKAFPIFEPFDHLLTSYNLGYIKPRPEIYTKALEVLQVRPGQAFYVDDRPELIEQAIKLGLRAFVFTGTEQLKRDLALCGIVC